MAFNSTTFHTDLAKRATNVTLPPVRATPIDVNTPIAPPPTPNTSGGGSSVPQDIVAAPEDEIVVSGYRDTRDHRVRLSAFRGQEDEVYGAADPSNNILTPLHSTNGLLFPYTPSISISQDTSYSAADLEQSNYDILSYQKSSSAAISVNAKFTVQNQREGEYMLAAIHFLRTVSKSYFGEADADIFRDVADNTQNEVITKVKEDGKAGLPPPVLIFSGYGNLMFNDLRVVVKNYSWALDENMDMIRVAIPNGSVVYLPPVLTISIGLGIQSNTNTLREQFSLSEFRTGRLLTDNGKGWF